MTFPFTTPFFSLWQVEASPVEGSGTKNKKFDRQTYLVYLLWGGLYLYNYHNSIFVLGAS
jgi:hypothetical protein